jgi:hypothetical protein
MAGSIFIPLLTRLEYWKKPVMQETPIVMERLLHPVFPITHSLVAMGCTFRQE